jgi:hypothetical protein
VRSCSKEGKWGMLGLMLCLSQTADHMWRVLHSACCRHALTCDLFAFLDCVLTGIFNRVFRFALPP